MYIFGGFDGAVKVNDFWAWDFEREKWSLVNATNGKGPSPRHSHSSVVHANSMYVLCGYDGSYKNDFFQFSFSKKRWTPVVVSGTPPRSRYRATTVVHKDNLILFGGHDGARHLNDTNIFNFTSGTWIQVSTNDMTPSPRDSHIAIVYEDSMFLYGGSTGMANDEFFELKLDSLCWTRVPPLAHVTGKTTQTPQDSSRQGALGATEEVADSDYFSSGNSHGGGGDNGNEDGNAGELAQGEVASAHRGGEGSSSSSSIRDDMTSAHRREVADRQNQGDFEGDAPPSFAPNADSDRPSFYMSDSDQNGLPGARFCHSAAVYEDSIVIFGGYDGSHRLNDFIRYRFYSPYFKARTVPSSSLLSDLKALVNNPLLSDVRFLVEDQEIFAHKLLCARCLFFNAMLTGSLREVILMTSFLFSNIPALVCLFASWLVESTLLLYVSLSQKEGFLSFFLLFPRLHSSSPPPFY
jgi:hypothetical protein